MKIYNVGGAVRDSLMGVKSSDNDWVVVGSSPEEMVSNGFKLRTNDGAFNDTGGVYVYWAIGQTMVGTNNIPCTAR